MTRHVRGRQGEKLAAQYLTGEGYTVVERNFRSKRGEVDVIAVKGDQLVFAEVKSWNALHARDLEYSVDRRKRRRITETSRFFLLKHPEYAGHRLRFDLLFISHGQGKPLHIKNAFDGVG